MLNIVLIGLVSFFTDISTEMVYPMIPLYLTSVFGATPALIGLIEGIAESVAALLKVYGGYIADRFQKKKTLAFLGYTSGLAYKVLLLFAGSWGFVLFARVVDRIGKGIRTAPRDVLVGESASEGRMGHAFGIHKALDMAGSALGILAAFVLLSESVRTHGDFDYRNLFLLSMVPAVLGLAMFAFIREKRTHPPRPAREPFRRSVRRLDGQLKLYLGVTLLFTLGNSSNTFLLLRAKDVGFDPVAVVLLYFLTNATASALSIPMGRLSDRIGRKRVLVAGYLVFAAVYAGFAFAAGSWTMVAVFVLYGFHTAMVTGVERAYITEISPPDLKGTMLGLQSTIVGIALLPASVIAGVLWDVAGAPAPFLLGSGLALAASALLLLFMRDHRGHAPVPA